MNWNRVVKWGYAHEGCPERGMIVGVDKRLWVKFI